MMKCAEQLKDPHVGERPEHQKANEHHGPQSDGRKKVTDEHFPPAVHFQKIRQGKQQHPGFPEAENKPGIAPPVEPDTPGALSDQ
ncbi:MAG: hypothetical protein AB7E32_10040 [Desulfovibrio sp.]